MIEEATMLTLDERKKCVEIWELFTNQKTKPEDWNEKSANALACMVANVRLLFQRHFMKINT
jgi:hypothetical protein